MEKVLTEKSAESDAFILTLEEVEELMDSRGIDISNDELIDCLLYHHSKAAVFYFNTTELKNHVVIDTTQFIEITKVTCSS